MHRLSVVVDPYAEATQSRCFTNGQDLLVDLIGENEAGNPEGDCSWQTLAARMAGDETYYFKLTSRSTCRRSCWWSRLCNSVLVVILLQVMKIALMQLNGSSSVWVLVLTVCTEHGLGGTTNPARALTSFVWTSCW